MVTIRLWSALMAVLMLFFVFSSIVTPVYSQSAPTRTPIKHVIIILLENHAFDSIYGVYPFGYPEIVNNVTLSLMRPVNYVYNLSLLKVLNQSGGNVTWIDVPVRPGSSQYLHPYYANSTVLVNPHEGYTNYHEDWDWGKMDGFVNGSGPQSLAYVSYQQVPLLWDYAEEYVLFDNFFSPTLSVTVPNRIAYITGFPTKVETDAPQFGVIPFNESVLYQLNQGGVSWAWYEYGYSRDYQLISPTLYLGYNNTAPLPVSLLTGANRYEHHYYDLTTFVQQARNGSLPAVSFVMLTGPLGYDSHVPGLDMHPPYNTTLAMLALSLIVNSVMTGKDWNSSAIFITFDEGGGYYDPVPPPIVPGFGIANAPTLSKYGFHDFLLGQRIPLLVISPFSKEGFVDNYTTSGYSILAFIEWNWGLPYLNPIVREFGYQGILDAFNFTSPRPPLPLTPSNWSYPVPLQYSIHYGYVATINNNYTAYQTLYEVLKMGNYSPPSQFLKANVNAMGGVQASGGETLLGTGEVYLIVVVGILIFVTLGAALTRKR